jgi:phosphoadenosine phosphosulfate reductase
MKSKINKAREVLDMARNKYGDRLAIAWTGGKDSTLILDIVKKHFGFIPFPALFIDSTMEYEEIYQFIDKYTTLWKIELFIEQYSDDDLKRFYSTQDIEKKKKIIREAKIYSIKKAINKYSLEGYIVGIRRDEHEARSKERYASPREDHIRIHPILDFSEQDVWKYIKKYNVPYSSLYDRGYRSLGEKHFSKPIKENEKERSGRQEDKERFMENLRNRGYW